MKQRIRATKLELLEFIRDRQMIQSFELRDHFGYTESGARGRLSYLKKQGLVINMTKDRWELTVEGFAKLIYYGRV